MRGNFWARTGANVKVAFCTRTWTVVKISIEAARLVCPESKDETHFLPLPLFVPIEFDPANQCSRRTDVCLIREYIYSQSRDVFIYIYIHDRNIGSTKCNIHPAFSEHRLRSSLGPSSRSKDHEQRPQLIKSHKPCSVFCNQPCGLPS